MKKKMEEQTIKVTLCAIAIIGMISSVLWIHHKINKPLKKVKEKWDIV